MEVGSGVGRWGGWGVGQVAATGREFQLMRMEDLKPSQHYNLPQLRISNSLNPQKNRKVMHHYFSVNLLLGMITGYKPTHPKKKNTPWRRIKQDLIRRQFQGLIIPKQKKKVAVGRPICPNPNCPGGKVGLTVPVQLLQPRPEQKGLAMGNVNPLIGC